MPIFTRVPSRSTLTAAEPATLHHPRNSTGYAAEHTVDGSHHAFDGGGSFRSTDEIWEKVGRDAGFFRQQSSISLAERQSGRFGQRDKFGKRTTFGATRELPIL